MRRSHIDPSTFAVIIAFVVIIGVGLWWQFGAGVHRETFTVESKRFAAIANDGQSWQLTTTDGTRFYTNAVEYRRLDAGERVSCLVHGRSLTLPILPDHLQSVNLCRTP